MAENEVEPVELIESVDAQTSLIHKIYGAVGTFKCDNCTDWADGSELMFDRQIGKWVCSYCGQPVRKINCVHCDGEYTRGEMIDRRRVCAGILASGFWCDRTVKRPDGSSGRCGGKIEPAEERRR